MFFHFIFTEKNETYLSFLASVTVMDEYLVGWTLILIENGSMLDLGT